MTDQGPSAPRFVRDTPPPPVRIVHLGLGAFARSHTAWYTSRATDAADWGIAAYAGRSRALADSLSAQDVLYTLVERGPAGDRTEVIGSVVRAHAGSDVRALLHDLAAPSTSIVTLTITEAGYRLDPDGSLDVSDAELVADLELLRAVGKGDILIEEASPATVLARLTLGLELRRRNGAGALTLLSCDNLPDNGGALRRAVTGLAAAVPGLAEWVHSTVRFASSSVDRITPRLSAEDAATLQTALGDHAPVVAEPFSDWVISGDFPAGRPAWETAGARFVEDLEPWEARKLWLLNGSHTLLACLGSLRGHTTVAEAIADPTCRAAVEQLWDEAARSLPPVLDIDAYRAALLERFGNARISHSLAQIASDTRTKLRLRIAPVAVAELAAGRAALGCATVFAAWITAEKAGLIPAATTGESIRESIAHIHPPLAADEAFVRSVEQALDTLTDAAASENQPGDATTTSLTEHPTGAPC